jgi:glycyl-tRNA synthetase alpha subunit
MSSAESMPHNEAIENPEQLGERYLQELRDLVDERQITAAFAQRVVEDLFDAGEAGQMVLKWSVWCSYIEEQQQLGLISELRELPS